MRWISFLSLLVSFLLCGGILAAPVVEVGRRDLDTIAALHRRDDQDAAATTIDSTTKEMPTATATDQQSETATATSSKTSASATSESTSIATTVPSLDGSTTQGKVSSNGPKSAYHGGLPIQPSITPALAVAGAILLILGAALALIGIRKPRVYIFLSTALLAALGVTVLIEYVMTPPASNAVQGGYLVAVFFTGIVFGGLALVFQEITEGLCCLLGGFCIGMWFQTLKSGGLVTEQGSKIGFIIAFTAGFYCLSFSHYTRSYGSILCTSFAGSTALVLGIDCFSRAGLKEFWLYIWGLNDDMFPLNTYTYPVTRNIRVEIAITIIVAVFGVIAQMRLWKVIKERRAKDESTRLEAQRQKEETDAEAGRQLEEKNLKERAEWEHMYGNGDNAKEPSMTETAVAEDSRRGSEGGASPRREKGSSFEMKDMASPDQSIPVSDCGGTLDAVDEVETDSVSDEHGPSHQAPQEDHPRDENDQEMPSLTTPVTHRKSVPEIHVREDNDSEHGAVLGSEAGTRRSKRFSGTSLANRLSWRSGHSKRNSQSQEALVPEDATSSVAGIVDDVQSVSSQHPSIASDRQDVCQTAYGPEAEPKELEANNLTAEPAEAGLGLRQHVEPVAEKEETNAPQSRIQQDEQHAEDNANCNSLDTHGGKVKDSTTAQANDGGSQSKKAEPMVSLEPGSSRSTHSKDEQTEVPVETVTEVPNLDATSLSKEVAAAAEAKDETAAEYAKPRSQHPEPAQDNETIPETIVTEKKEEEKAKLDRHSVKRIPEQTSKVIHSFRTREWAKHLADAETPDLEPLEFDIEPEEDPVEKEEAAAPIDVEGLLQTALNAQPPPVLNQVETEQGRLSPEQSRRQSRISAAPSPEIPRSKMRHSMQNLLGGRSSTSLSRHVSSPPLSPLEQDDSVVPMRSTSTPHLTITAPGETNEPKESPRWSGPPPLLALRENMVRNRMSSTSLRYDPWAGRNHSRQSVVSPDPIVSPPLSIPDEKDEEDEETPHHDEDDLPLSKRRVMLQRQTMQSPSEASVHSSESARSPQYTTAEAGRSASRMAAWRQSVREDLSQKRNPLAPNSPTPGSPSPDRPRSLWGSMQQMRDASSTQVGNAIADGMQRGNMTDLHRQAMRKMQASANRKL